MDGVSSAVSFSEKKVTSGMVCGRERFVLDFSLSASRVKKKKHKVEVHKGTL